MKKVLMLIMSAAVLSVILAATTFAATYTVTNTANTGAGSLRRAINDANGNPGADVIDFNIVAPGVQTIALTAGLPNITDDVLIDGFTQPGSSTSPRTILIELDGFNLYTYGLRVAGGTSTTIRGLAVNNFTNSGIRIDVNGVTVEGCTIGTDATGTIIKPNGNRGIFIPGSSNNIIGGSALVPNLISGNTSYGIEISGGGSGNVVANNFVGTDAAGTAAIPNGTSGIYINNSASNTIGGLLANQGNLVSGNTGTGIQISGAGSTGNNIQGNYIGTDAIGTTALGNVDGLVITNAANNNTIGNMLSSGRNFICGNSGNGVEIRTVGADFNAIKGNYIGLGADLSTPVGNGTNGVVIVNGANNTIGGGAAGEGNVIVASGTNGVRIANASATLNKLYGNYIGIANIGGTLTDMGNASAGVVITNSAVVNYIGGSIAGQGNFISGNDQEGVDIDGNGDAILVDANEVIGNYIGTDASGANLGNTSHGVLIRNAADNNKVIGGNIIAFNGGNGVTVNGGNSVGNLISSNSIHSNTLLGVDLRNDGVDVNDVSDGDGGPNNGQNYPVIMSVTYDGVNTNVAGTFNSALTTNYNIDLYSNTSVDATQYGEGETYVMTTNVTTDGVLGDTAFLFAVPGDQRALGFTAMAYDFGTNDTSEFSRVDTADLSITKAIDIATPYLTQTITYTITVTNNGPDTATGVIVNDLLPSSVGYSSSSPSQGTYTAGTGIWAVGTLLNGASATLTVSGTVDVCGSVNNTAAVNSDQFDSVAANNNASAAYSNNCPSSAGGYKEGSNLSMGIINPGVEPEEEVIQNSTAVKEFCLNYTFEPKDLNKISRYEFLYLMLQLNCFEIPAETTLDGKTFTDLPRTGENNSENLVIRTIYKGYDEEIISGYSDSTVKPYNSIVFAEAAKMLFKSTGMESTGTASGEWYEEYMSYLKSLLNDYTLDPAATVTKFQADAIVDKLVNK